MSGANVQATQQDLLRRDTIDSGRATAPLAMADDAHHLDTTPYTLEEVIDQVVALVEQATSDA
jgi:cytidylate kinase